MQSQETTPEESVEPNPDTREEGEAQDTRPGNKYQWADVISNDESVLDVYVVGDEIRVIYQLHPDLDLSWIRGFMEERDYAHEMTSLVYQGVNQDTFVDQQ